MNIKDFRRKYSDSSEFVFGTILKSMTNESIRKCIEMEMKHVEEQISEMKKIGFIYNVNGIDKVTWSKYENMRSWDMTADEQVTADRIRKTLSNCEHLLYIRKRLIKVNQL